MFIVKINGEIYFGEDFFEVIRVLDEKGWKLNYQSLSTFSLRVDAHKLHATLFYSSEIETLGRHVSELPSNSSE